MTYYSPAFWMSLSEIARQSGITFYTAEQHRREEPKQMTDDKLPSRRLALVEKINGTLANMELAQKRLEEAEAHLDKVSNDAKAMVGTAKAELKKQRDEYNKLRQQLDNILPGPV